jgi:hypothetical protein
VTDRPPPSPLAEPAPDPRVLTATEAARVTVLRQTYTWYRDGRAVEDVGFLLRLLDRLTAPTTEESS